MTLTANQLFADALALPEDERAELAARLLESLPIIRGYSFADPADDLTTNSRTGFGFRVLCEVPE